MSLFDNSQTRIEIAGMEPLVKKEQKEQPETVRPKVGSECEKCGSRNLKPCPDGCGRLRCSDCGHWLGTV